MIGSSRETLGSSVATILAEFFLDTEQRVVPTLCVTVSKTTRHRIHGRRVQMRKGNKTYLATRSLRAGAPVLI